VEKGAKDLAVAERRAKVSGASCVKYPTCWAAIFRALQTFYRALYYVASVRALILDTARKESQFYSGHDFVASIADALRT
jgi:hypothetical protein